VDHQAGLEPANTYLKGRRRDPVPSGGWRIARGSNPPPCDVPVFETGLAHCQSAIHVGSAVPPGSRSRVAGPRRHARRASCGRRARAESGGVEPHAVWRHSGSNRGQDHSWVTLHGALSRSRTGPPQVGAAGPGPLVRAWHPRPESNRPADLRRVRASSAGGGVEPLKGVEPSASALPWRRSSTGASAAR
jgi:hypothetical protein